MATTTTYLGLRVDDTLTPNAKLNLNKIDNLASVYRVNSDGTIHFRSKTNIIFTPQSPEIAGSGVGGEVQFGSASQPLSTFKVYANSTTFTTITLVDQASTGTKSLFLKYKSDIEGSPDTSTDRTLFFDLEGANRNMVLGGDFQTVGTIKLIGSAEVNLPSSGTLSTLSNVETLTNKTIDANVNTLSNISNNEIAPLAAIQYSKLNLLNSISNDDISSTAALSYSKLNLSNSVINSDISNSANIDYSKLNLLNSISNNDISPTANIIGTKIVPMFGAQDITTYSGLIFHGVTYTQKIIPNPAGSANYTLMMPPKSGDAGQILAVDALGKLYWASVITSPLPENQIDIGSSLNERVQVDTNALGDVKASTTDALKIKDAVIEDKHISSTADITLSKLKALTASRAIQTNSSGVLEASTISNTELGHLSGVTSGLQSQLNGKQPLDDALTGFSGFNSDGLIVQTAKDSFTSRSVQGTLNRLDVLNGDGIAGNPTLNVNPTLLPSPLISDAGSFLKTTAADTGSWASLAFSDLPALTQDKLLQTNVTTGLIEAGLFSPSILNKIEKAQTVTVAKSGGDFTTIQGAIDSIVDATLSKQYVILIYPGVYTENVVLKSYIHLAGIATGVGETLIVSDTINLSGTIAEDQFHGVSHIGFLNTATTDGQACVDVQGSIGFNDVFFVANLNNDVDFTFIKSNSSSFVALFATAFTYINSYAGITKSTKFIEFNGDGTLYNTAAAYRVLSSNFASGDHCVITCNGQGNVTLNTMNMDIQISGTFTGTWKGICFSKASTLNRIINYSDLRLTNHGSGGTAIGIDLNTSGNQGEITGATLSITLNGFTTEYITQTATGDTQKIFLSSTNKTLKTGGNGLSIVTPLTLIQTGRDSWGTVGATYWSYNPATKVFTVDKRGTGLVLSAPVVWAGGQSTAPLTDRSVNFIYMDSSGFIGSTTSPSEELFRESIMLFEVWVQDSNFIVTREDHPVEFSAAISRAWHNLFGSLLQNATQTLAINSAANRTVNLVGNNILTDHGLDSDVPAQTPITWNQMIYGVSGAMVRIAQSSSLVSVKSNSTDTGIDVNNNRFVVYRLGVIKDSLNTSDPIFISIADTNDYPNLSGANNAIANGNIVPFPPEAIALEICQLGFAIVKANGSGAGTLESTTTALQVFGAQFVSGGTSTSASLITTSTTNFNRILSGTDTNVQLALDTIDNTCLRVPYSLSFNDTTDWGSASGGFYTLEILAAVHLRGTTPFIQVKDSSGNIVYVEVIIDSSGNVSLKVPEDPDLRFAGTILIIG